MFERLKAWGEKLKLDVVALWFAYRHPDTPWYARIWTGLVVAYAFSPIDLIPDFIPILGLLDDVLLVPAGIWLAIKLIPTHAIACGREQARAWLLAQRERPRSIAGAVVIALLWLGAVVLVSAWLWRAFVA